MSLASPLVAASERTGRCRRRRQADQCRWCSGGCTGRPPPHLSGTRSKALLPQRFLLSRPRSHQCRRVLSQSAAPEQLPSSREELPRSGPQTRQVLAPCSRWGRRFPRGTQAASGKPPQPQRDNDRSAARPACSTSVQRPRIAAAVCATRREGPASGQASFPRNSRHASVGVCGVRRYLDYETPARVGAQCRTVRFLA